MFRSRGPRVPARALGHSSCSVWSAAWTGGPYDSRPGGRRYLLPAQPAALSKTGDPLYTHRQNALARRGTRQTRIPFPSEKRHNKAWTLFQSMNAKAESSPSGQSLRGCRWPCAPHFCWFVAAQPQPLRRPGLNEDVVWPAQEAIGSPGAASRGGECPAGCAGDYPWRGAQRGHRPAAAAGAGADRGQPQTPAR